MFQQLLVVTLCTRVVGTIACRNVSTTTCPRRNLLNHVVFSLRLVPSGRVDFSFGVLPTLSDDETETPLRVPQVWSSV